jgi:hypothetical protein
VIRRHDSSRRPDDSTGPRRPGIGDITSLLERILTEVRQLRVERARKIEPKWLTIAETVAYTGMSTNWVRSLEGVAPRGLFTRVKGTVFVNRAVLDDIFEGNIELEDA